MTPLWLHGQVLTTRGQRSNESGTIPDNLEPHITAGQLIPSTIVWRPGSSNLLKP